VHGLDATAAQTFGTLWTMLARLGVELVITCLEQPGMLGLLEAHGVIGATCCRRARFCLVCCMLRLLWKPQHVSAAHHCSSCHCMPAIHRMLGTTCKRHGHGAICVRMGRKAASKGWAA
jgi:hypothetical protein